MSIKIDKRNIDFVNVTLLFGLLAIGNIFLLTNNSFVSTITAQKQGTHPFNANLTGNQEAPPTNIISTGKANFQVDSQSNNLSGIANELDFDDLPEDITIIESKYLITTTLK